MNPPGPDLKAIFGEALDHAAGPERAAYLDRACRDAVLRDQVESLLKAHDEAGRFLVSAAQAAETSEPTPATDDPTVSVHRPTIAEGPGTTIGPYKLLQKIGEGGMGAVFMAEQIHPVRRKVALKVIKPGMDTAQVIARFEAERQALAMMDHPNIARVLDVGATETGRHFFVMELVKGVPITEYCDRNSLTPKERLALFIPVCQAIQHAHQKGIIHRDIKPSNVLVTLHDGVPVPKVIDFGVAKAIEQRLTEKTLFTEFGAIIGTLEYMSPEQAEMGALDIDTRSDIYSLGVLLYELLTGSTPLERARLRKAAYSEILKRIREEEPTKPSTRLSESNDALPLISAQRKMEPARLTRLVRGELDWIVMKSLEKDRTRRYETATGFARDVQRYLDGDPVEACPPSATYKLKKFARRHRAALATVGAFTLLLIAATAISLSLAFWASRERKRAEDREQMAIDAVKRFGDAIANESALKNTPALVSLRKRLLKEPLYFFSALRNRLQSDHDTRPESLVRLAAASTQLGFLTHEIGDKQDALIAYRESLAIYQKLIAANPTNIEYQFVLAANQSHVAGMLSQMGQTAESLRLNEGALTILERLAVANPSDTRIQLNLAIAHFNIGEGQRETGNATEALKAYESALVIHKKLAEANPTGTRFQMSLAITHNGIGNLMSEIGKRAEAIKAYESALAIEQRVAIANPTDVWVQGNLAGSYYNLGNQLRDTGKPAEAMNAYESALAIRLKLAEDNPTITSLQDDLANNYDNIGVLLTVTGKPDKAMKALEAAAAIWIKLSNDNPSVTDFQHSLVNSHNLMGHRLRASGKQAEARNAHLSALAISERLVREHPESPDFASGLGGTLLGLAVIDLDAKRFDEARIRLREAIEWQRKALASNPAHPRRRVLLADQLKCLIVAAQGLGDADGVAEAERELAKLRDSDPNILALDARLAAVLQGQTPRNDAERIQLALRAQEKALDTASARLFAEALSSNPKLGDDRLAQHRYNAACAASKAAGPVPTGHHIPGRLEPALQDAEKARLRAQALGWLKAELSAWTRVAMTVGPGNKEMVAETLQHWKTDPDLAAIRDEEALATLPDEERSAFRQLWADVDRLLIRTTSRK